MKRKLFLLFLACAFSATVFTGCDYSFMSDNSGMKNIDRAHKEAFESAFNDIEIFGARLCVPMKVSELPDKFELSGSGSEYAPLSEDKFGGDIGKGLKWYGADLYYDREIRAAYAYIICKEDQSIEDGIIYELEFNLLSVQSAFLGGQVDIRSDIGEIKNFLGEGNEFYEKSEYSDTDFCTLYYTDGNKMLELSYGIQGDDTTFFYGYIRTYNNYR